MPNYLLCCTVCSKECGTRMEWLAHLLEPSHQAEAMKEVVEWSEEDRRCTLVAFGTFPVACMELLQFFSRGPDGCSDDIVTDFVYDKSRPRVGILQFESRKKVSQILKRLGKREVRVKDELVNLRMGEDYLQLEWNALLPTKDVEVERDQHHAASLSHLGNGSGSNFTFNFFDNQSNQEVVQEDQDGMSSSSSSSSSSADSDHDQNQEEGVTNRKCNRGTEESNSEELSNVPLTSNPGPSGSLWDQFQAILAISAIPDNEYKLGLEIMNTLKCEFRKKFPLCNIYMIRHWYLKMRSMETTELLLFVDYTGHLNEENTPPPLPHMVKRFTELINSLGTIAPGICRVPTKSNSIEPRGFQCVHETSGLKFCLVYQQPFLIEAQTCNLFKYLCEFDPRVRPLIGWIFSWVKSNDIKLSPEVCPAGIPAPEPAAWEWLIMLFLSKQRIVPCPNEILKRRHKNIFTYGNVDIGFAADMKFAKAWVRKKKVPDEGSNELVVNVLTLASKFLAFCNTINQHSHILSSKHGVFFRLNAFIPMCHNASSGKFPVKLPSLEVSAIRNMLTATNKLQINPKERLVFLFHPFCFTTTIPFLKNRLSSNVKFSCTAHVTNVYIKCCRNKKGDLRNFPIKILLNVDDVRHRRLKELTVSKQKKAE